MDGPLDGNIYERTADSQTIRERRIFKLDLFRIFFLV